MPSYFTTPYPDETLHSLISRQHRHTLCNSSRWTLQDLFGRPYVRVTVDLPAQLQLLAKRLPPQMHLSSETLAREHTLFPFYTAFANASTRAACFQLMCGNGGIQLYAKLGFSATALPFPTHLRYCPICNAEDMTVYGEYYWHRLFQIPGVLVCPQHNVMLVNSSTTYRPAGMKLIAATENNCGAHEPPVMINPYPILRDIAIGCERLLVSPPPPQEVADLLWSYTQQLIDAGFLYRRRLNLSALDERFAYFVGKKSLQLLRMPVDREKAGRSSWLGRFISGNNNYLLHPLLHILIGFFLEALQQECPRVSVFGPGPWPCLNPADDHFMKDTIRRFTLPESREKIIGTFACDCGFSYTRKGPDLHPGDRYVMHSIETFGPAWEQKLRALAKSGMNDATIAAELNTTSAMVRKCAMQLGIIVPRGRRPAPTQATGQTNRYRSSRTIATDERYCFRLARKHAH